MPGKMTKSILRPPFRPPRYRQPSAARVYLAGRSEKRKIFTSAPGVIWGIPVNIKFGSRHSYGAANKKPRAAAALDEPKWCACCWSSYDHGRIRKEVQRSATCPRCRIRGPAFSQQYGKRPKAR